MSPTSYHCSIPRCFLSAKVRTFIDKAKNITHNILKKCKIYVFQHKTCLLFTKASLLMGGSLRLIHLKLRFLDYTLFFHNRFPRSVNQAHIIFFVLGRTISISDFHLHNGSFAIVSYCFLNHFIRFDTAFLFDFF